MMDGGTTALGRLSATFLVIINHVLERFFFSIISHLASPPGYRVRKSIGASIGMISNI
jgi:hypothetical protein